MYWHFFKSLYFLTVKNKKKDLKFLSGLLIYNNEKNNTTLTSEKKKIQQTTRTKVFTIKRHYLENFLVLSVYVFTVIFISSNEVINKHNIFLPLKSIL